MILALMALLAAPHDITFKGISYHGWKSAVQISNGKVDLVFVPEIGRIMRYGPVGGPNVLWENPKLFGKRVDLKTPGKDWTNFGGDKLWPAPQDRWGWPPDPAIDSARQEVKSLPNGLVTSGIVSKKHDIWFMREITMDSAGDVRIKNTMVSASKKPVRWSIWEVTQVDRPELAAIPANLKPLGPNGYRVFKGNEPPAESVSVAGRPRAEVRVTRDPAKGFKVGSDPNPAWGYALTHGLRFEVSAARRTAGTFPDGGCSVEIWCNADPDAYMELELLSPIRTLAPGQRYTFETRWHLTKAQ